MVVVDSDFPDVHPDTVFNTKILLVIAAISSWANTAAIFTLVAAYIHSMVSEESVGGQPRKKARLMEVDDHAHAPVVKSLLHAVNNLSPITPVHGCSS